MGFPGGKNNNNKKKQCYSFKWFNKEKCALTVL